jgi:predicted 3-demethylubiquinone-9 3-methyltransferase (glyoxalase superfamily)
MPSITPSLWFDNDLEEAAEFYTSVFPNSKIGRRASRRSW